MLLGKAISPLNIVPAPISSLTKAMQESESVNPIPIPIPSKKDGIAGFFEA